MSAAEREERRASRISLQLPIRVEAQESKNVFFREITRLVSVSPLGASFYLKRKFAIGQLVLLTMPMPIPLRSYDHTEHQYCVWSIVRHSNPLEVVNASVYHTGVAFIGKYPPLSYKENPQTIYRISEVNQAGFYDVTEERRTFSNNPQPRYSMAMLDAGQNITAQEYTVTENISRGGAAVFSTLPVKVGDLVKLTCEQYNVSLLAEVRCLRRGDDGLPRLHLRFVDQKFPLQGIEQI
jgi:hypothetical protein